MKSTNGTVLKNYRKAMVERLVRMLPQLLAAVIIITIVLSSAPVLACSTCGCSEICPLAMIDTEPHDAKKGSLLTESIWGNLILKMAYARDPELQKLLRKLHISAAATSGSIGLIAGATLGQNVSSLALLNPPAGTQDSYVPGGIGLGLDGAINVALTARILLLHKYRQRMKVRQNELREQVEAILQHLEFSETSCPQAQHDLVQIIGERGAQDCIALWQSSHVLATNPPAMIQSSLQATPVAHNGAVLQ
jgi:hypothetical protein